ncbi:MAG: monofunctional biosynthetic peptidoglycan transglycosylase [Myxococcota bacterium]
MTKPRSFAVGVLMWGLLSAALGIGLGTGCRIATLRFVAPDETAFQRESARRLGRPAVKRWLDLDDIDQDVVRAVLAAEDQRFYRHSGFDRHELSLALQDALRGKRLRGASTLSQQLAKNLYLSGDRSLTRKLKEAGYTLLLELILSKERILELYMNEVAFGPDVYGVEAGAQHHFGCSAADLSLEQAAQLAAVLPAPHRRRPGVGGAYDERVEWIMERMRDPRLSRR